MQIIDRSNIEIIVYLIFPQSLFLSRRYRTGVIFSLQDILQLRTPRQLARRTEVLLYLREYVAGALKFSPLCTNPPSVSARLSLSFAFFLAFQHYVEMSHQKIKYCYSDPDAITECKLMIQIELYVDFIYESLTLFCFLRGANFLLIYIHSRPKTERRNNIT